MQESEGGAKACDGVHMMCGSGRVGRNARLDMSVGEKGAARVQTAGACSAHLGLRHWCWLGQQ